MGWFSLWRRWGALPRGMRRVVALSALTAVTATALLYQSNAGSQRGPTFTRGGPFGGGGEPSDEIDAFAMTEPTPTPPPEAARSRHTLFAPDQAPPEHLREAGSGLPTLPKGGKYTFAVDGYEETTGFGRRNHPSTMTMTAHRQSPPGGPRLRSDEIVLDLEFSSDSKKRQIASYVGDGVLFTYEASSVTFGPVTEESDAGYRPPVLQVPFPLDFGVKRTGSSHATDPDGEALRTEDWTIEVLGRETIEIMGQSTDTWIVKVERHSRPGASEKLTQTRQYWFDTARMLWVKWTEDLRVERPLVPGTSTYDTKYTATLTGFQPLS